MRYNTTGFTDTVVPPVCTVYVVNNVRERLDKECSPQFLIDISSDTRGLAGSMSTVHRLGAALKSFLRVNKVCNGSSNVTTSPDLRQRESEFVIRKILPLRACSRMQLSHTVTMK